jgi:bis(5'-nucleosyl)-tetraphosphatase (symmetrical)
MRTIVIGDIHGCLNEFKHLLAKVAYQQTQDRLICAGDLVDRGPYSAEVVSYIRERGIESVMGNHDEKHCRWAKHEARRKTDPQYKNPMKFDDKRKAEHDQLSDEDRDFLAKLPYYLRFEHQGRPWLVTHAGIPSDKPIHELDPRKLVRCRTTDKDTGAYSSTGDSRETPPNGVYWVETWKGPESVVYGHIVHADMLPLVVVPPGAKDVVTMGIDTGCCFGGSLTAAVFATGQDPLLFSVLALKTYMPRRNMNSGD